MFYCTNVYTKKNLDFALKEKVDRAKEVHKAFSGYEVIFGVFSKSGFTKRMLDIEKEHAGNFSVHEEHLV